MPFVYDRAVDPTTLDEDSQVLLGFDAATAARRKSC
jgi:hypothetical protein